MLYFDKWVFFKQEKNRMARRSKISKSLEIAENFLLAFDSYFRDPEWVINQMWFDTLQVKKGVERLVEKGILDKNLNFKKTPQDTLSLVNKKWDRHWRLISFDIPQKRRNERDKIRRLLYKLGFRGLQRSVWITPLSVNFYLEKIDDTVSDSSHYCIFIGKLRKENPKDLVKDLWNVEEWSKRAVNLRTELESSELNNELKEKFWNLAYDHPRVPLDLLPNLWPLESVVKLFIQKANS